jgi:hypothetical protein
MCGLNNMSILRKQVASKRKTAFLSCVLAVLIALKVETYSMYSSSRSLSYIGSIRFIADLDLHVHVTQPWNTILEPCVPMVSTRQHCLANHCICRCHFVPTCVRNPDPTLAEY